MLVTPDQMQTLEAITDRSGITYGHMMERAGKALADTIMERYPEQKKVLFLAGTGNNGGDCYAAAYHLKQAGWLPEILAPNGEPRSDISIAARDRAKREGIPMYAESYDFIWQGKEIIVDGIFGTGFHGDLSPAIQEILKDREGQIHIACDLPTGGNAASGAVCKGAFRADLTVTFGAEKLGMSQYPLRSYCGEIVIADIGIPADAKLVPPAAERLTLRDALAVLPTLAVDAYKNQRGHLLTVTGSTRMRGAAALAAESAMRSGVGMLTCASAEPALSGITTRLPEAMCLPLETDSKGFAAFAANTSTLSEALSGKTALLIGCGMGQTDDTAKLTEFLLQTAECPVILDADGLNVTASHIDWIPKGRTILTPHPAEAARLLGTTAADVQNDRPAAAAKLAKKTGAVVVLKGAGTIITDGKRTAVCNAGNPGMARAGMGDVLAGITASLAAQGISLYEAACAAVMLHAAAGDAAAAELPAGYMLPQDLIVCLQDVFSGTYTGKTEDIEDPLDCLSAIVL